MAPTFLPSWILSYVNLNCGAGVAYPVNSGIHECKFPDKEEGTLRCARGLGNDQVAGGSDSERKQD